MPVLALSARVEQGEKRIGSTKNSTTMNRSTQLKCKQWGIIAAAWLGVGFLMSCYDHLVLTTANSQGLSAHYSFGLSLLFNLGSALAGALLGGGFLVFFVNVRYQDKPYGYTILAVSLFFVGVMVLIAGTLGLVSVLLRTGRPVWDPESVGALSDFLLDSSRAKNLLAWSVVVTCTQLLLQVSSKFGPEAFGNMLCGKYNTPREEDRIFMFLDLDSSTALAERLGNEKYHALLKDFFADITHPILNNQGEIYQYVGDEVVVAWKQETGRENNRCVRCFFDIKERVEEKREHYLRRYGVVPSFKAGIHCGKVVAGEVGILKRDITYSGDVLNTASRMLSMCKTFGAEVIASAELVTTLGLPGRYAAESLGAIQLKGKSQKVGLCALTPLAR
jgi:adenylate cyclase